MAARLIIPWMLLLLLATALAGCGGPAWPPPPETVTIKGESFTLEVAADADAIEQGLMHRESIPDDGGMLFIFPDQRQRRFWMGHCLVDIDIIFLDARGMVTAVHRMKAESPRAEGESEFDYRTRLPDYPSRSPAQFAIELKAGTLDRLNVRVEDRIELDLPRLKALPR